MSGYQKFMLNLNTYKQTYIQNHVYSKYYKPKHIKGYYSIILK